MVNDERKIDLDHFQLGRNIFERGMPASAIPIICVLKSLPLCLMQDYTLPHVNYVA